MQEAMDRCARWRSCSSSHRGFEHKLCLHLEHHTGCKRQGRQRVGNGSSCGASEQVLGQTVREAGQGCGARATQASTHQRRPLALGRSAAIAAHTDGFELNADFGL